MADDVIRDLVRAMESLVWAMRPQNIRSLPRHEQEMWKSRIMLEIVTGKRRD